jgi:hypothetical protein
MIIETLTTLALSAALYLALHAKSHLASNRHLGRIVAIKETTFLMLAFGIGLLALGSITDIYSALTGSNPYALDFFYFTAYLSLAVGFTYFWMASTRMHKLHIKEPIFMLGVTCGVIIWLVYLYREFIIPMSFPGMMMVYIYPVMVAYIFLSTLIIHPRMKGNVIRTPLWYISSGIFCHFIAFNMKTYSLWDPNMVLPYIYPALFLVSALYFMLGFYAAKKKYSLN